MNPPQRPPEKECSFRLIFCSRSVVAQQSCDNELSADSGSCDQSGKVTLRRNKHMGEGGKRVGKRPAPSSSLTRRFGTTAERGAPPRRCFAGV